MSKLFLVPTPIGNLGDMTFRAVEVLLDVSLILAEDTRTSGKLLRHYEIDTPMRSFHQHNEHKTLDRVVSELLGGTNMALITDAGTPGISDPGFLLARACAEHGIAVECLPGATSFVPALVVSGLPIDRFVFEGFLPHKKGRKTRLAAIAQEARSTVLFESPHRIGRLMKELQEVCGDDRKVSVSREISKMYEETLRGRIAEMVTYYAEHEGRGEYVVVIEGVAPQKSKR